MSAVEVYVSSPVSWPVSRRTRNNNSAITIECAILHRGRHLLMMCHENLFPRQFYTPLRLAGGEVPFVTIYRCLGWWAVYLLETFIVTPLERIRWKFLYTLYLLLTVLTIAEFVQQVFKLSRLLHIRSDTILRM